MVSVKRLFAGFAVVFLIASFVSSDELDPMPPFYLNLKFNAGGAADDKTAITTYCGFWSLLNQGYGPLKLQVDKDGNIDNHYETWTEMMDEKTKQKVRDYGDLHIVGKYVNGRIRGTWTYKYEQHLTRGGVPQDRFYTGEGDFYTTEIYWDSGYADGLLEGKMTRTIHDWAAYGTPQQRQTEHTETTDVKYTWVGRRPMEKCGDGKCQKDAGEGWDTCCRDCGCKNKGIDKCDTSVVPEGKCPGLDIDRFSNGFYHALCDKNLGLVLPLISFISALALKITRLY
ncbi:MAG: hypothetical protein V1875_07630 [Candidatus Altiarchaeota archaeon]